jgi:hypothetical protein
MNISLKALFILLWATLANTGCYAQKQKPEADFKVIYKAQTRGSILEYAVDNKSIIANSNGVEGKNGITFLKSDDKEAIVALIGAIELDNMKNLIPQSQNYTLDRALIANVIIVTNGKEYESSTFDHGNPPSKLIPLIDKILALAETVE